MRMVPKVRRLRSISAYGTRCTVRAMLREVRGGFWCTVRMRREIHSQLVEVGVNVDVVPGIGAGRGETKRIDPRQERVERAAGTEFWRVEQGGMW